MISLTNVNLLFAQINSCSTNSQDPNCLLPLPHVAADNTTLQSILSILFGVIGAVTVIIIIIQGIKFSLSGGDAEKAATARKAIIYAVIGLAVSISAEIIVNFVLGSI